MAFPVAILCFFLGSVLIWVGAHGTNATSPFELFKEVISGLTGENSTDSPDAGPATEPAQGEPGSTTDGGLTVIAN